MASSAATEGTAGLPGVVDPPQPPEIPQLSLAGVIGLWAVVVLPMAWLALYLSPVLIQAFPEVSPGLIYWASIILGMAWQFIVSVAVLISERPSWSWTGLKRRLWLNAPRDPRTGAARPQMLLWIVPLGVLAVFLIDPGFGWLDRRMALLLPDRLTPAHGDILALATPENKGAWEIVAMAAVSSAFNYVFGEALFFHGILLPRCQQVFGRFNWLGNALLFGLYHIHKAAVWPSVTLSCIAYSYPAQRTGSIWPALLIHAAEGLVLMGAVVYVVAVGV